MYGDRRRPEFITGMHNFLHVAEANMRSNGFICKKSLEKGKTAFLVAYDIEKKTYNISK
jgi:hypothetical protein